MTSVQLWMNPEIPTEVLTWDPTYEDFNWPIEYTGSAVPTLMSIRTDRLAKALGATALLNNKKMIGLQNRSLRALPPTAEVTELARLNPVQVTFEPAPNEPVVQYNRLADASLAGHVLEAMAVEPDVGGGCFIVCCAS